MTDAGESQRPADEGLTPEERRMLDTLASGAPAGERTGQPAASGPLRRGESEVVTAEEARVLDRAREESERLSRTSIRGMFERDASSTTPGGLEARPVHDDHKTPPGPSAFERSLFGRALASCLEVANAPFRWLPPAVRLGLGLGGVLLLITLLVVILVRMLFV